MNNTEQLKKEISDIGKRLYAKGFSPGHSGNISVRSGSHILVTPSGMNLGDVQPQDVVEVDFDGNFALSGKKPTSEKIMHLGIYKERPDVNAIVHCHAPKSSAFAVAGVPLDAPILAENVFVLGQVPIVQYAMPSSNELAQSVSSCFKTHDAVLMANHGVAVAGNGLSDAYYKLETLEYYAEVYLYAKLLGRTNELSKEEVQKIIELRAVFGK